ncbi:MAG: zinc transporter ZitB [Methanomassiliicoccales archaeon PtaB.Bin215]|nr:MAG: zinc transporter ZitB [Methanomassiliicoccales archaeon PtaB.Bin215]
MLTYALVITAAFALVEVIGGVLSGSLALLGDAGHMFTDVLALGLSLGASLVAGRQATERHTYGFLRAEILVALVNGMALVVISLLVMREALGRLADPTTVDADLMLLVAIAGMGANLLGMVLLHRGSKENLNVRGAFLHMMGDLLSSFGVIAAALLIRFFGWQEADALIGLAIAAIIMIGAYRLISQSVSILLEAVPKHIELREVEEAMTSTEGVLLVHDLHVWTLSSGVYALSGHVVVSDQQVSACSPVLRDLESMLEDRFHISHVTIQLETEVCPDGYCSLKRIGPMSR